MSNLHRVLCISGLFNTSSLSLGPILGLHYEDCRFFEVYGYTCVCNSGQIYEAQALQLQSAGRVSDLHCDMCTCLQ